MLRLRLVFSFWLILWCLTFKLSRETWDLSNFNLFLIFIRNCKFLVDLNVEFTSSNWQGMKLLPTGRKSSLAIFLYSSAVSVTSVLSPIVFYIFIMNVDHIISTIILIRLVWGLFSSVTFLVWFVQYLRS